MDRCWFLSGKQSYTAAERNADREATSERRAKDMAMSASKDEQRCCPICKPDGDPSPTVREAHEFLKEVAAMLTEKNARYGDSAANPMRVFSRASAEEQLLVRIDDKISRIARGDGTDDGEDTIKDLVGYLALLAAVRRRRLAVSIQASAAYSDAVGRDLDGKP